MPDAIQSLCEQGQQALLATDYLAAERLLVAAEALAWRAKDFDALARLYMPLQEARRQRRQQSADGPFLTILLAAPDLPTLLDRHSRGQYILAAPGSIAPAATLRTLAAQRGVYADVPLAAGYVVEHQPFVLFVPTPATPLPHVDERTTTIDELFRAIPPGAALMPADALPPAVPQGTAATFGFVMSVWETLHALALAAADAMADGVPKLAAYRKTIRIDYACEFAHQRFSDTARQLSHRK